MNDPTNISRVEFWRQTSERSNRLDNNIINCIDGRCFQTEEEFLSFGAVEEEKEAIRQGFRPDNYYSAFQKMLMAKSHSHAN